MAMRSPPRPPWMWVGYLVTRGRIARWFAIRALRPTCACPLARPSGTHCAAQRITTSRASARFRFGGGRRGEVRHAADIPVGIAGIKSKFAAFAPGADTPASLREGDLDASSGRLDVPRDTSNLRERWADTPLRVKRAGHYIPSAADFGENQPRKPQGPRVSASYF